MVKGKNFNIHFRKYAMIVLYYFFISYTVLLCMGLSTKELKDLNTQIDEIKLEITKTIGRENEGKETVDDKVIKKLEDIANAKIAIETLSNFAINMTAQDYANLMFFEKKFTIPEIQQGHNAKKEMNEMQNLKKELDDKIEEAKKFWKKNGKGRKSQSQTQIIEMKVKLELMDLMKESNLLMSRQYENLAKECAKFGETEKNEWGKKLVEMFLKSLKEKMDKLREKLNKNDWMKIDKLEKSLSKTIKGEKPHEEAAKSNSEELSKELRSTSEEASKAMEKHLKMDWKKIGIYSQEQMSNWRLAMHGYWALINFHKIGIVSNAKKIIELLTPKRKKKGQQQQQHQESKNDKEKYQQWLEDNAKLYKTVYERLFPQNDDDAKKGRRRRKRGFGGEAETSGCSRSRVDWSAWLQCISLILLIIILIWLIIAALIAICSCILAADNGGRRGGGDIFIFNNSSTSSSSSGDCCCCFGTSSSSRGYSYGRPALTYFDSCSVVWWDLWN